MGKQDMCQAMKEIREDGVKIGEAKGLAKGRVEGKAEGEKGYISLCKEFNISLEETITRFVHQFHVSKQEAVKTVNLYWN